MFHVTLDGYIKDNGELDLLQEMINYVLTTEINFGPMLYYVFTATFLLLTFEFPSLLKVQIDAEEEFFTLLYSRKTKVVKITSQDYQNAIIHVSSRLIFDDVPYLWALMEYNQLKFNNYYGVEQFVSCPEKYNKVQLLLRKFLTDYLERPAQEILQKFDVQITLILHSLNFLTEALNEIILGYLQEDSKNIIQPKKFDQYFLASLPDPRKEKIHSGTIFLNLNR